MSDGEIFLLIFAAIYLCDCFLWEKRTAMGFLSIRRKRWWRKRPGDGFGNDKGGLLFQWPFPPLGTSFIVTAPDAVFAPEGVSSVSVESPNPGVRVVQAHRFVRWDAIQKVEWAERDVFLNGEKFVKCAGPAQSSQLAKRIKRFSKLSAEARVGESRRMLRASLRTGRVENLTALFFKGTGWLRMLTNMLLIVAFFAVPLTYRWYGPHQPFFLTLLLMLLLMINGTAETFCLHRKFFPKARGERWQHMFIQSMLPQHGMRALDFVSRRFLDRFHPLAVASVLLDRRKFEAYAAAYYRDLCSPLEFHDAEHEAAKQALAYRDAVLLPEIESFLKSQDLKIADLLAPRADMEEDAKCYCPRCLASYIIEDAVCDDCGEKRAIDVVR